MKKQTVLRFTKRFAALAGAAVLTAVTALGGNATAAGTYSTTIGGNKTMTFAKYLVMDKDITVPNVTFTYTVSAGDPIQAASGTMEVLAGVDAGAVTMAGVGTGAAANQIKFENADRATSTLGSETIKDHATDGAFDPNTQQFVKKEGTLDFSACNFTEPGIYRYKLTEDTSAQTGVTFDPADTRIIDVYVVNDATDLTLKVENIVMHSTADTVGTNATNGSNGVDPTGKSQGFTNWYTPAALTVEHKVTGNQASQDKYFAYTVEIQGTNDAKYSVILTDADATLPNPANAATDSSFAGKVNPATITADSTGKATQTFYLQHGQKVVIKGLKDGDTYTVKVDKEDYSVKTPAGYVDATGQIGTITGAASVVEGFLLERAGLIPTGVIMTVAPFAAITALGAAGIAGFARKKKHEDEE